MSVEKTLISFDTGVITTCALFSEEFSKMKENFGSRQYKIVISSLVKQEALGNLSVKYKDLQKAKTKLNSVINCKKFRMETKYITRKDRENGKKILKEAKKKYKRRVGNKFLKDAIIIAQLKRLGAKTYTTDHWFHLIGRSETLNVTKI